MNPRYQYLHVLLQQQSGLKEQRFIRFVDLVENLPVRQLHHLNPHTLAHNFSLDADDLLSWFLMGIKVGLFQPLWNLVCPDCGCREHQYSSLAMVPDGEFECTCCSRRNRINMTMAVLSFQPSEHACPRSFSRFTNRDSYLDWHFVPQKNASYLAPASGRCILHSLGSQVFSTVSPGSGCDFNLDVLGGKDSGFICLEAKARFAARWTGTTQGPVSAMDVRLDSGGFQPAGAAWSGSSARLCIRNTGNRVMGILACPGVPGLKDPSPVVLESYPRVSEILQHPLARELFGSLQTVQEAF